MKSDHIKQMITLTSDNIKRLSLYNDIVDIIIILKERKNVFFEEQRNSDFCFADASKKV
jgi:hypothetical protein